MQYYVLALIQGLTEFIPVSSSGHLVVFQHLFGLREPMLAFDILLHLATALAVMIFLREELFVILRDTVSGLCGFFSRKPSGVAVRFSGQARVAGLVALAMIPSVLVGVLADQTIERLFSSLRGVAIGLFLTGAFLSSTYFFKGTRRTPTLRDALLVGVAQALAIIPGISRSGSTISAGMFSGMEKTQAAKFSFLLALPTILAAAVYKLPSALQEASLPSWPVTVISFFLAFGSGLLALRILSRLISQAKFHWFAVYCWALAGICLWLG